MRITGIRADGALWVALDGGMAVVLRADRCSPPVDPQTIQRLGPWQGTPIPTWDERLVLARRLERARTVPLSVFHLGDTEGHPFRGNQYTDGSGGGGAQASSPHERAVEKAASHSSFTAAPGGAHVDTETAYRHEGKWSEPRQALHTAILNKQLAGKKPATGKPVAVMMGGGPASGKSTMLESGSVVLPPDDESVHIDPDALKKDLPEFQKAAAAKDPRGAAFAHEESSHLSKVLTKDAARAGHHVVVDGTGNSDYDKLAAKVKVLRDAGHTIKAYYATNDVELAVKLAKERGDKTGRYVPEEYTRAIHASVSRVLPEAIKKGLYDEVKLFNTDVKGHARPIATAHGKHLTIHDEKLWQEFLAKGK
jgi:predicted ABC-type ATPase